ncbi:MAG TPA: glycosyltransferase family 2 protein [Methylomirabilota bacterium]|nr:glycosyltransferase family 2 protein [Methylomirabilota bacterium]
MRRISRHELAARWLLHVMRLAVARPRRLFRLVRRAPAAWREEGLVGLKTRARAEMLGTPKVSGTDYRTWIRRYDGLSQEDREAIERRIAALAWRPRFSLLMRIGDPIERRVRQAIDSVLGQLYACWELCVIVGPSVRPDLERVLEEYRRRDPRIRLEREPRARDATARAWSGDFVADLGEEDVLPAHALFTVAAALAERPDTDLFYTDEDRIDERGDRADPHFKPDWNLDLLLSHNYLGRLVICRASLADRVDGMACGSRRTHDDLGYVTALRLAELTTGDRIHHIPHVLYHRRYDPAVTGAVGGERAREAVRSYFERRGGGVEVTAIGDGRASHRLHYPLPAARPLVSLIIPSRDRCQLLNACVSSIVARSDYRPFELVIVDNGSREPDALAYLEQIGRDPRVRIVRDPQPFNFSALINAGVRAAAGEVVGLMNSDAMVISPGWLSEMVSHALRPEVGVVGAKLSYPDDTIQHAGIVVGIHGVCGHVHRHRTRDAAGYTGRARVVQQLSAVTAACMVMRREIFDAVGGFDEHNLAIAFNDIDLCLRVRALGYRTVWTPWAELYHREGASRGADYLTSPRFAQEIAYMKRRWASELAADPFYNPNLTLTGEDFELSFPPRVVKPWRVC